MTSPWAKRVGMVFTTESLIRATDMSDADVRRMVRDREVIALQTSDNKWVFPAFQFDVNLVPLPGLAPAWWVLVDASGCAWTSASWILLGNAHFGDQNMVDYLRGGGAPSVAMTVAEEAAERWSH